MAENLNLEITTKAWADIVIDKWEQKMIRLGIGDTHRLLKSFYATVHTESEGNPKMIEFAFEYYGKFIDMGVGKGVKAGEWASSNRRPKPWYSGIFFGQVKALASIIAGKDGQRAALAIIENLGD